MKLIVTCLFIIANISNNGKASIESFLPTSTNILLEDTTKNTDKSCYRPCKFNVKPRWCHYSFKIEPSLLEDGRAAITVNGMTPGPPIQVCMNDIIVVDVQNKVPDQYISMHWHGVEQKGTPYMDGVPMVTQCPIAYGSTYKYAFIASSPGTFFYHTDSVSHQSDGAYGSLIVNQPQPLEPHSSLYDYDRSSENTLIIAAKFPQLLTASLEDLNLIKPESLVINGEEESFKLFVIQGFAYRLRLINAVAVKCPVTVNVDQHEMVVIATDGKPVKPVAARNVILHPGERMDVVVRATQNGGGYWVRVRGTDTCEGLTSNALFIYSGFNYTSMLQGSKDRGDNINVNDDTVYGQMLESIQEVPQSANVKSVYLGIDRNIVNFKEHDNDYRYISDAVPKKPFYPAYLSLQDGVVQINKKNFLYPNAPLLLRPKEIAKNIKCTVGKESEHQEPQCMLVLDAPEEEILELALVNEGFGSNDTYTFHMHGYSMQVVATSNSPDGKPLSREEFRRLDKEGKILRNIQNPPLKDTIIIPNKGYTIVRIKPDRGGTWLLECRDCGISSLPAALVINVPLSLPKSVIDAMPKCGNYKPPDVLLN